MTKQKTQTDKDIERQPQPLLGDPPSVPHEKDAEDDAQQSRPVDEGSDEDQDGGVDRSPMSGAIRPREDFTSDDITDTTDDADAAQKQIAEGEKELSGDMRGDQAMHVGNEAWDGSNARPGHKSQTGTTSEATATQPSRRGRRKRTEAK